jgi:hypothetical protein
MIPRYSVFRGPGNRLVAISVEPLNGAWLIKTGEQGKRLRSSTIPESKYSSFSALKADHLGEGYQQLFTGTIDAHGNSTDVSASVYYWEARSIDVEQCRSLLREAIPDMQSLGVDLESIDDMSGTRLTIAHTTFGLSRAPMPGCIGFDGNGAGTLSVSTSADLLCLLAWLAKSLSISITDADGKPLTRGQVITRCGALASNPMSDFLEAKGVTSLVTSLRKLSVNQVRF